MIKPMFWAPNADTQAKQEWEVTQSFWTKLYFKCVILVLLIWKKKISVEKTDIVGNHRGLSEYIQEPQRRKVS